MSTRSTLMAVETGVIVLTFGTWASLASTFLAECGKGLEAIVRLVMRRSSSFNCDNVRLWRAFCSADSRKWIEIKMSVQSGVGASSVVRICFSLQVATIGREGNPSSDVEIIFTWSYELVHSRRALERGVPPRFHFSSVVAFSGIKNSDAAWPVRTQLMQNVTVPCTGSAAGTMSLFKPWGFYGQIASQAGFVRHELNVRCIGFRAQSFRGQSATKWDGSQQLKHALRSCCQ